MSREKENKIRSFICLEIPKNIRETIDRNVTRQLKDCGVKCSWVKPENIHITLKFLGDIPEKIVPKISEILEKTVGDYNAISLSLGKVGKFGGRTPRVIWVGNVGETEALKSLAESVDKSLLSIGFKREKRKFSPHLTIGRVRNPKGTDKLLRLIDEIELPETNFVVKRVILMKSELSPGGSIYTPLAEFELK
ncbi:RNA 2',3'-cyclic phosphodiesterase [bacterium]|nr:MAG: RNA 2',3'-cyclic phosphodiesterase [bacterium]